MADPRFYDNRGPFALGALAAKLGAALSDGADPQALVNDVAAIGEAGLGDICFAETRRFANMLGDRTPSALIVSRAVAAEIGIGSVPHLIHPSPAQAFADTCRAFYPEAGRAVGPVGGAYVDPTAKLGEGVVIETGAVVGPGAEIGANTRLAANAFIGRGVCIGRDSYIGPSASVIYALLGDRVWANAGVRIGTDGFGFASGAGGHLKVPQLGRVIVQDDVEIGANSCIDRGALGDTVIGEGAKIDNLVQVAHNCQIGRRAILVAQVGLAGSVTVGDWSVLGGQVGVADHVVIGAQVRLAARSGVMKAIPAPGDYGGVPAQPIAGWRREMIAVRRLGKEVKRRDE